MDYERFIPLNADLKQLVTDWQVRVVNGKQLRNDHSDKGYDDGVLARFPALHQATIALIDDIASHVPSIADCRRRLAGALARFNAGDHRYFTAPDRDSYHTVWFEFHQEMIGLLGTTRAKGSRRWPRSLKVRGVRLFNAVRQGRRLVAAKGRSTEMVPPRLRRRKTQQDYNLGVAINHGPRFCDGGL